MYQSDLICMPPSHSSQACWPLLHFREPINFALQMVGSAWCRLSEKKTGKNNKHNKYILSKAINHPQVKPSTSHHHFYGCYKPSMWEVYDIAQHYWKNNISIT
jgi:hypothetical protein